jgi:phage terminase small subunit
MKKFYAVVDRWLENNYDPIEAYQSVYPNASRRTASVEFAQIKKIPEIAEYIKRREKEAYDSANITLDRLYQEMASIAFSKDPEYPQSAKIRMLEVLTKNLKEDEGKTANTMKIVIGVDDDGDSPEEEDI